jgi:hypothetical protein
MNRRTLDVALPMLYAAIVVATATIWHGGKVVGAVAAVGAILLGVYYAALRRNLK